MGRICLKSRLIQFINKPVRDSIRFGKIGDTDLISLFFFKLAIYIYFILTVKVDNA